MIDNEQKHRPPAITNRPRAHRQGYAALADHVRTLKEAGEHEVAAKVSRCSTWALQNVELKVIQDAHGRRRITGLNRCKHHLCPVCGPGVIKGQTHRWQKAAIRLAEDPQLVHFTLTLTVRHDIEDAWAPLRKTIGSMREALKRGGRWQRLVVGFLWALESSYGQHGHHPHEHLLLSLRPPAGWDASEFFSWVEQTCQRAARAAGATCAFSAGWWAAVPGPELVRAVSYLGHVRKLSSDHAGQTCHGHGPVWALPPAAYAEVYRASHGCRWFGSGGCWKVPKVDQKAGPGPTVWSSSPGEELVLPHRAWASWAPREQKEVWKLLVELDWDTLAEFVVASGGARAPSCRGPAHGLEPLRLGEMERCLNQA